MLELAMNNDAKILQASTSGVYVNPTVNSQPKVYHGIVNPIGPRAVLCRSVSVHLRLYFPIIIGSMELILGSPEFLTLMVQGWI